MNDLPTLQRLLVWLSPAFPVGSFAWSGGLEMAIATGLVRDAPSTQDWVEGALHAGTARTDAILLAHAHRCCGDEGGLKELADLCLALTAGAERADELTTTGRAFLDAVSAWTGNIPCLPDSCPYPVALGAVAGEQGLGREGVVLAFLVAYVHTQISVAVRLVPIGQRAGLHIIAALEPIIADLAAVAAAAPLEAIASISYAADIAQMRHERLETRLFRS